MKNPLQVCREKVSKAERSFALRKSINTTHAILFFIFKALAYTQVSFIHTEITMIIIINVVIIITIKYKTPQFCSYVQFITLATSSRNSIRKRDKAIITTTATKSTD